MAARTTTWHGEPEVHAASPQRLVALRPEMDRASGLVLLPGGERVGSGEPEMVWEVSGRTETVAAPRSPGTLQQKERGGSWWLHSSRQGGGTRTGTVQVQGAGEFTLLNSDLQGQQRIKSEGDQFIKCLKDPGLSLKLPQLSRNNKRHVPEMNNILVY